MSVTASISERTNWEQVALTYQIGQSLKAGQSSSYSSSFEQSRPKDPLKHSQQRRKLVFLLCHLIARKPRARMQAFVAFMPYSTSILQDYLASAMYVGLVSNGYQLLDDLLKLGVIDVVQKDRWCGRVGKHINMSLFQVSIWKPPMTLSGTLHTFER